MVKMAKSPQFDWQNPSHRKVLWEIYKKRVKAEQDKKNGRC